MKRLGVEFNRNRHLLDEIGPLSLVSFRGAGGAREHETQAR
jgi:hypothetical protein